ncbi:hypothetical protein [Novipirellula galeiformis]|uniref:hypothetical protein n=1 Tax=Novipirellula galeiformis TaxID=2528004 RepID=UPI0018CD2821|nr:hypothetical protein [Novipirellula galeiformis]
MFAEPEAMHWPLLLLHFPPIIGERQFLHTAFRRGGEDDEGIGLPIVADVGDESMAVCVRSGFVEFIAAGGVTDDRELDFFFRGVSDIE